MFFSHSFTQIPILQFVIFFYSCELEFIGLFIINIINYYFVTNYVSLLARNYYLIDYMYSINIYFLRTK